MAKLWDDTGSNNTNIYNAIGRRSRNSSSGSDNFFTKKAKSIENALGTTGAVIAAGVHNMETDAHTKKMMDEAKKSMDNIAQKYGYANKDDFYDASIDADENILKKYGFDYDSYDARLNEAAMNNDQKALDELDAYKLDFIDKNITGEDADKLRNFTIGSQELRRQAKSNLDAANERAKELRDWAENNYVSKKISQDRGKFLGSAINTLSTAADVMLPGAGVAFNAVQGGVEGIADELEDSGFKDFDWRRAGQNAAIGAITGGVTGAVNQGISSSLAKNGGNLFKGGNKLTRGINTLGSSTPAGRIGSTIATGAGRGAISGAVGGATGAGLSSAMNGASLSQGIANTIEGAKQGALQGAGTGATMAGVNMALNATPGVGKVMRDLNQASEDWKNSGSNFDERLTNTLTSGDSIVGEWLQGNRRIGALNRLGSIGNRVQDIGVLEQDPIMKATAIAQDSDEFDSLLSDISDRAKQFRGQYNQDGTRPWSKELYDYSEIDPELLNTLGISDRLDGSSAAAVTSVLRDRGLISGSNGYSYIAQNHSDLPPDIQTRMEIALANGASPDEIDAASTAYHNARADADRGSYANYKSQLKGYNKILKKYGADADFVDEGSWTPIQRRAMQSYNVANSQGDTPTTLGGWLKKAGERVVEDVNGRGAGLSIKDVGNGQEAEVLPRDVRNMQINNYEPDDEATLLYRTLMGESEPSTTGSADLMYGESELGNKTGRGMLADSLERLGNTLEGAQTNVTRAATKDLGIESTGQVVENVRKKTGLTNLETQAAFAKELTGSGDSLMDNVQRRALTASEDGKGYKVDTSDIMNRVEAIVDDEIPLSLFGSQSARNKFVSNLRRDISSYDSDVISKSNKFKGVAADLRGKGVVDPPALDKAKSKVYTQIAKELDDLSYNAIPQERVDDMFDVTINEMRGRANNSSNKQIARAYNQAADQLDAQPRTIPAFRSFKKDFVDVSKINELTQRAENGAALQMGRGFGSGVKRFTGTLLQRPVNAGLAKIGGAINTMADKVDNGGTATSGGSGDTIKVKNTATPVVNTDYNPQTRLYNSIGRTEGEIQGENAASGYLQRAARTSSPVTINNNPSTALYNSVNGTAGTTGNTGTATLASSQSPTTMTSGNYYVDLLYRAMMAAAQDNNAEAFGPLYEMFQDALASQQKTETTQTKLTDKQRQANAAERALNDFEGTESNFAYDVSDIPIIGGIANLGGNEYASKAEALALQIGYMLSGATVNAQEAKNIGMAYVPQPRDSEAVRRSKLAQIRGIISDYQQTYEA